MYSPDNPDEPVDPVEVDKRSAQNQVFPTDEQKKRPEEIS